MGRLRHPGMKNENPPLWMTLSEACAHLGVKERALRSAVQRGEVERRIQYPNIGQPRNVGPRGFQAFTSRLSGSDLPPPG